MTKTSKKKAMHFWMMTLLCLSGIYYLSSQTAAVSSSVSRGVMQAAVTSFLNISKTELPLSVLSGLVSAANNVGRECMHGIVFLILAFFWHHACIHSGVRREKAVVCTFIACLLYGLFDECHQLFVPGRAFQLFDLLMDGTGSLLGIILSSAVIGFFAKQKVKRRSSRMAGAYRPLPARPVRPEGF